MYILAFVCVCVCEIASHSDAVESGGVCVFLLLVLLLLLLTWLLLVSVLEVVCA